MSIWNYKGLFVTILSSNVLSTNFCESVYKRFAHAALVRHGTLSLITELRSFTYRVGHCFSITIILLLTSYLLISSSRFSLLFSCFLLDFYFPPIPHLRITLHLSFFSLFYILLVFFLRLSKTSCIFLNLLSFILFLIVQLT